MPANVSGRSRLRSPRQALRGLLLLVSICLFPVTIWYFSPYLPFMGLTEGVIAGSLLVFGLLFLSALPLGRLFCGWLCPAGALQHFEAASLAGPLRAAWLRWVKYLIWAPWAGAIAALWLRALQLGQVPRLDIFFQTEGGVSLTRPAAYFIYGGLIFLVLFLAALFGRRGFCHSACWMAPFMVLGRSLGRLIALPSLRLKFEGSACSSCASCSRSCPMSLPVMDLVREGGGLAESDCILCFQCADVCPRDQIRASFDARSGEIIRRGAIRGGVLLFAALLAPGLAEPIWAQTGDGTKDATQKPSTAASSATRTPPLQGPSTAALVPLAVNFGLPSGWRFLYRESLDNKPLGTIERRISREGGSQKLFLATPRGGAEILMGADGLPASAILGEGGGRALRAERVGRELHFSDGLRRDLAGGVWLQDFLLLAPFIRGGEERAIFLIVNANLDPALSKGASLFRLKATKTGRETLTLGRSQIETVKVHITFDDPRSLFWGADYWFRARDGVLVRYVEVRGGPGTKATIGELVEED